MGDDERRGRRRIALVGVSSLFLVAMVVAVTVGVGGLGNDSSKNYNHHDVSASMRNIKTICQSTDYKEVCVDSLSSAAGNTTDPKELVRIGFEVAIKHIKEAAKNSTVLQELQKDPRSKAALESCQELADLAIKDLQKSFDHMGEFDYANFNSYLADLKTWLSGAMTYQETCLDGFENTEGDAGEKMRESLKTAQMLTSNALAMVTEISTALASLNFPVANRRLLSEELPVVGHGDDFPSWVSGGMRRLLRDRRQRIKANLVVAKDGSGNFTTINEALKEIPKNSNTTFVLYIKEGIYEEKVQFNRSLTHLMVVGDGPTRTRITGKLNWVDGTPTFQTATVAVLGSYFVAKDIGFENAAGPEKHQAVALRVGADMSVFYNCHMDGYQDTLYAHTYRQYYRNCVISGTIDFIFGDSSAIFQNCKMVVRKPLDNQQCIVTAQGRKEARQPTGLVLQNCTITSDRLYYPVRNVLKSYLARPWKEFSRTIIMESFIDDLIQPEGFLPWGGNFGLDTSYYVEYNNRGPGSSKLSRVRWAGIKHLGSNKIKQFTANEFILGDTWVLPSRVPYIGGLIFPPPPGDISDEERSAAPAMAPAAGPAPAASPVASPAASPVVSPVASPIASPVVGQAFPLPSIAMSPEMNRFSAPAPSPVAAAPEQGVVQRLKSFFTGM